MRPIKLVVEGVRSYRAKTEVDFSGLTLVALIGDTGAGKSSLIEAICLALYGSTTWAGRGVLDLMTDGADRMAVELTFSADGDIWTVTRGHRRTGGAAVHKLTSASGEREDGADAVNKRIQAVVGLSRDQFLKAVVMPQGRFEELLKASPAQRTDILKGVFRLQALDGVRAHASAVASRWREPVAELRGERSTLPTVPALAVAEANEQHRVAAEVAALLDTSSKAAEAEQEATERAARRAEVIATAQHRAEQALDATPLTAIEPIAAAAVEIDRLVVEATADRDRAARDEEAAARDAVESLGGFETRDAAITGRDRLRHAATALEEHLAEMSTAAGALAASEADEPAGAIDAQLDAAADTARLRVETETAALRTAVDAHAEAAEAYRRWNALRVELATAIADATAASADHDNAKAAQAACDVEVKDARAALVQAQAACEAATRTNAAAAAAAACQPGDDCPVCARPLPATFRPPIADDLDRATAAVDQARRELDRRQSKANEATKAVATAAAKAETSAAAAERADAAVTMATDTLGILLGTDVSDDLTEDRALDHLAGAVSDRQAAVDDARRLLVAAEGDVNRARSELAAAQATWRAECDRHREAHDRAAKTVAALRQQLAALPARWRPGPDAEPARIGGLADEVDAALADHERHSEAAATARASQNAAAEALLRLDTRRAAEVAQPTTAVIAAAARTRVALAELGEVLGSEVAIPEGADPTTGLAALAAAVTDLHAVGAALVGDAATEHRGLLGEVQAHAAQAGAILHDVGVASLGDLRTKAGGATVDAAHAKAALERVEAAAARAEQIDATLAIATPFLAALDALCKLLTDGRFVGHLVREREKALLTEASRVLRRLSADRFGFRDGFAVIDRHSGQERSPDTLSGGERFQASLALALALVEIATRSGGQLEAVFVDEGFGSLDAASLDQALTTLGAIASGGKLVALVSHLRQVAEYVDQVLLVEYDDAAGSRVKFLDPSERDTLVADDARSRMTG